jgi:hypothetical protein
VSLFLIVTNQEGEYLFKSLMLRPPINLLAEDIFEENVMF